MNFHNTIWYQIIFTLLVYNLIVRILLVQTYKTIKSLHLSLKNQSVSSECDVEKYIS